MLVHACAHFYVMLKGMRHASSGTKLIRGPLFPCALQTPSEIACSTDADVVERVSSGDFATTSGGYVWSLDIMALSIDANGLSLDAGTPNEPPYPTFTRLGPLQRGALAVFSAFGAVIE